MVEIDSYSRIVVLGAPGSGKSTLAADLARRINAEHIELDGLFHGPNWRPVGDEQFRERLVAIADRPRWVVDGVYRRHTAPVIWPHAELIIWLDLPLRSTLPRLIARSVRRAARRTRLWNGNVETWRRLLGRDSILVYAVGSHHRLRQKLEPALAAYAARGVAVVRVRRRCEIPPPSPARRSS